MIVYGASGHGLVILDILQKSGFTSWQFVDDAAKPDWVGGLVKSPNEILDLERRQAILAIGNNRIRKKISTSYNFDFQSAIHPSAILGIPMELIGVGTVIMAGVVINPYARIGSHVILNTGATIDHECIIEDFVHISPNATLSGDVHVGEGTHIGAGAVIIQCIRIGKWATIGAGSVVIRDVPDYAVVVGNPARIIKYNPNIEE